MLKTRREELHQEQEEASEGPGKILMDVQMSVLPAILGSQLQESFWDLDSSSGGGIR